MAGQAGQASLASLVLPVRCLWLVWPASTLGRKAWPARPQPAGVTMGDVPVNTISICTCANGSGPFSHLRREHLKLAFGNYEVGPFGVPGFHPRVSEYI